MKEKIYGIVAMEDRYQGLHGISNVDFIECTKEEAFSIGYQMSVDLMESYGYLPEYDEDNPEEYELLLNEAVVVCVYEMDDTLTLDELREESINYESLIKKYGRLV